MNIPFWTAEGVIDLSDLAPAHFSADILGDAMAKLNRFSGRTIEPWSVAAHSVLVERLCPPELGPWALLHDAHEIILGDHTEPALEYISVGDRNSVIERAIAAAKARIDRVVAVSWNVINRSYNPELQQADRIALYAEAVMMLGIQPPLFEARDAEDIDRAITILNEMPVLHDWRDARDLWRARVDHYAAMGGLCPPSANPTGLQDAAGKP